MSNMQIKCATFNASLTACTFGICDAREQIARELRRIADALDDGGILSESGNMGCCDYGSWKMNDPFDEQLEKETK